jgi:DNA-binding CsgD family transcriptional regulator
MRLRSRRTLVAAAAAAALVLVAGGATALAESGSGSSGEPQSPSKSGVDFFANAVSGPVGSIDGCGPLPPKPLPDPLESAAAYLGLSEQELAHELEGGKSLAEVATAQGKSVEGLKQALLDAAKSGLDQAVADGHLTADEAQAILSKLRVAVDDLVNGKGGIRVRIEAKGAGPDIALGEPFKTAADYLGLSVDELKQELRAGKSLAEIAQEHGKSVSGLKQALVEAATADLEKAVDSLVHQKGLPGPCDEKIDAIGGPGVPQIRVADTP